MGISPLVRLGELAGHPILHPIDYIVNVLENDEHPIGQMNLVERQNHEATFGNLKYFEELDEALQYLLIQVWQMDSSEYIELPEVQHALSQRDDLKSYFLTYKHPDVWGL